MLLSSEIVILVKTGSTLVAPACFVCREGVRCEALLFLIALMFSYR